MELGGKFEVEDGNGGERDEVLAKLNVETFLIIPPKVGERRRTMSHDNRLVLEVKLPNVLHKIVLGKFTSR